MKLAKNILDQVNYNKHLIDEILEIISEHDTREGFISKNEGIMRDADKLWRFSKKGFWIDVKRNNFTPEYLHERLKSKIDIPNFFYSKSAKKIAREELKKENKNFRAPKINSAASFGNLASPYGSVAQQRFNEIHSARF